MNGDTAKGGTGFFGLLTIVFIVLKLCHVIGWSWWWVLSPVLIPLGVAAAICVVCVALGILSVIVKRAR